MFGRAIRGSSHAGASNRIQELRKTQRPVGAPSLSLRVTYEALFSRYRDLANALGEIGRSITATINRTALSRQDLAKSADTFAGLTGLSAFKPCLCRQNLDIEKFVIRDARWKLVDKAKKTRNFPLSRLI
jgi:hypothetical protein